MSVMCCKCIRLGPRPPTEQEMLESAKQFSQMMIELSAKLEKERRMGDFNINITATGGHGCDRVAKQGDKLHARCGRLNCPDCITLDFVQRLKQAGMFSYSQNAKAEFTHWPGTSTEVVDDMLTNTRVKGQF